MVQAITVVLKRQGHGAATTSCFHVYCSYQSCYGKISIANVRNSITKSTNSIAKVTNSIAKTLREVPLNDEYGFTPLQR